MKPLKTIHILLALMTIFSVCPARAQSENPSQDVADSADLEKNDPSSTHLKKRALIIGIDGARGDVFDFWLKNQSSVLAEVFKNGLSANCKNRKDKTCALTHQGPQWKRGYFHMTAPGWAAVLSGVETRRHLVTRNGHPNMIPYIYSSKYFPSFMKRAKDEGLVTAAAGVATFMSTQNGLKTSEGIIDYECLDPQNIKDINPNVKSSCNLDFRMSFSNKDNQRDSKIANWTKEMINHPKTPSIIMPVFDQVDSAGHKFGFSKNKGYLKALTELERKLFSVFVELEIRTKYHGEKWLILLTSDHGGSKLLFWGSHSRRNNFDNIVPFSMAVMGNRTKLTPLAHPVTQMDVHPTVMHWFGLTSPYTDGVIQGL